MSLLQKITVAECIETQSKAMTMLTIDQLSFLLKFALQKIKQPGVRGLFRVFCMPKFEFYIHSEKSWRSKRWLLHLIVFF